MKKNQRTRMARTCTGKRRRKLKRFSVRTYFILAVIVITSCFLMGAGQNAPNIPSKISVTSALIQIETTAKATVERFATQPASSQGQWPISQEALGSGSNWNLLLVNPWNSLPNGYEVTLKQLKNGQAVDERCYPDLQEMMDDCKAAGVSPVICSSYRTQAKQERLFNNKVIQFTDQGYSLEEAHKKAAKVVAVPGTSEHQLGLAVDIVDVNNQNLDESQEDTAVQKWLLENSWKYGFILRYPNNKSTITGIIYEPWHYRYVGKEAAKEIYEQGVCLEEYIEQYKKNG